MTTKKYFPLAILIVALLIVAVWMRFSTTTEPAPSDWPMWGYDDGRRASVDMQLPDNPDLLWVRELPKPRRAWPFQYEDYFTGGNPQGIGKLSFDVSYEPVVGNNRIYVPSMVSDKISAYAVDTGEELWHYYADGPVRFAPVYYNERIYFVSDDGYLYAITADSGTLLWKYKGSFTDRIVLGNERLISIWPARGGPVLRDGVIYFASGVLPFEGIFIHAVCADNGHSLWTNSTSGTIWDLHQHGGAWSYGGPSPQGYLAVSGDKLIVPGGRTPPAVYDRRTGEFLYFRQATGEVGKGAGGYRVHAHDDWFFNHGMMYALSDGAQHGPVPGSVLNGEVFIGAENNRLTAHSSQPVHTEIEIEDRLQRRAIRELYEFEELWSLEGLDGLRTLFFHAGSHLGFSRDGGRAGLYRLDEQGRPDTIVWEQTHEDEVWSMIPAHGKVFVVTEGGRIYCYGKNGNDEPITHHYETGLWTVPANLTRAIREQVALAGINRGYGVLFDAEPDLLKALADETGLHLLAVYQEEEKADQVRRRLDHAGLYGWRVAVRQGTVEDLPLPPYIADIVLLQDEITNEKQLKQAYELLRPYGGQLYVNDSRGRVDQLLSLVNLDQAEIAAQNNIRMITRQGPLPGSGQWTHQYGGASNRTYSDDERVRAPLGTLWFGGPSNLNILPRHFTGPIPQVAGGKLFILGVETISARCVYTGRELWVRELPGIGHPFTSLELEERFRNGNEVFMHSQNHPGANTMGSPYVSLTDGIYVIYHDQLLRLDPLTGETISKFDLPNLGPLARKEWGHILVQGDYLIAMADPQVFADVDSVKDQVFPVHDQDSWWNASSSNWLVVMDRHDGRLLWSRRAERQGYRHNAVAAGNNRLFVVDGLSEGALERLQRRGRQPETGSVLLAFDLPSGSLLWRDDKEIFGTWLGYYDDLDLLIEGGRFGHLRFVPDEPRDRMVARSGENGVTRWQYRNRYSGPLALHTDMIILGPTGRNNGNFALDPLTGEILQKSHPVTGEEYEWSYHRYYGCGPINSSKNLLMFRSGAAGYVDLTDFGGTANLGGFRTGCTNNMVAADGVLNAPDYTRTCTCSYQLQTSLGFAHMPDVEMWTLNRLDPATDGMISNGSVASLGINFGAPGNRRENGVLWLEYPKIYPHGPDAPISVTTNSFELFRHHATWIQQSGGGHPWVASYGIKGVEKIRMELSPQTQPASSEQRLTPEPDANHVYDITLQFAEPEEIRAGDRVFDVMVQGERYLENFDIMEQAGGYRIACSVTFTHVPVTGDLEIGFVPKEGSLPPVISGIEVLRVNP